jgi:PAS domain S-box-containing protein
MAEKAARSGATMPFPAVEARALLQSVKDYAIFTLTADGYVASWNAGASAIKGYAESEIVGEHFSRFYAAEDQAAGRPAMLLEMAARDGRVEDEGWRLRKDGSRFWADVVISAVRDDEGQLTGFVKVTRDLTRRRAAEEALRHSEEQLRLMLESIRDHAIFLLDPAGVITSWNAAAERLKGYAPQEIIGRSFTVFYSREEVAAGKPERALEEAARTGRYEEEGWRVRKDGSKFWANVVISPVRGPDGGLIGFTKVTRDMTERRRVEAQLREAERRAEFERLAVKERDAFITVAAHELRTPLTALKLKLNTMERVLKRDGSASDATKLAERLGGAVDQTDRLSVLVDRLLDVSRARSGELALQRADTDLAALTKKVVDDFAEESQGSGTPIVLEAYGDTRGLWDPARLEQVLVNLLSNALKYGRGKPVDVTVDGRGNDGVMLTVADRGIGIAAEDQERIFGRFQRAVPTTHYGGLGLGLYITQHIVGVHGGEVDLQSAAGSGATFRVRLPRRPHSEAT